ncbi:retrovirus-related pol polyprotein from transposon TNT 1-94 [Tanacetum coccineum]
MTTLADKSLLSGGDNKPPMLEKHLYDSWKSIMELYMMNRPHGRMILASVEKGPLVWPSITVDGVTRLKEYTELTPAEAIQADCDIKAINIILQGLPTEIYALVSQHRVAKDLWEKIKLLMQGTSLTKQERECKLYDEFDKFTYKKGESLHEYYLRFTLLLNDMNIYKMPLEQFQVNTKFLNTLPDEWSKFVTDVKLVKDLHTTNVDQLHAYLQQHERHANEVRLMHERNSDPLALVASHQLTQPAYQSHLHTHPKSLSQLHVSPYQSSQFVTPYQTQQFTTNQSTPLSITYPSNEYQSSVHHNVYSPQSSIPQLEYAPTTYQHQQSEFSQPDSVPTTNNQLRTSSNPRQQATIYDGKVTVQPVQGRQTTYAAGTTRKYTPGASGSNTGKQRTIICYNCKGEGHIAKQCTKPKRKRDEMWFNDKVLLVQAQASGQVLTEEEIAFLADPGLPDTQTSQTVITHNAAYQTMICIHDSIVDDLNSSPRLLSMRIYSRNGSDAHSLVMNGTNVNLEYKSANKALTTELDRYKEEVKDLKEMAKEQAVEQHRLESRTFEVKMNQVLSENERLLAQAIDYDIVKTVVNLSVNDGCETVNKCQKCLELKTELLNKKDVVDKETYDKLCKSFTTLEKHCITLEADSQLNQEIFQQTNSVLDQNAPSFTQLFELSELRAQSQEKDTVIVKLKEQIKSLKGNVDDSKVKMDMDEIETLNIELEHREEALVLKDIVEHEKRIIPHDSLLKRVRLSTSASGSQPSGNTRNDKILQTPSSNSKNKVEAHSRNVKSSLNKRNGTASVQNSKKHDNSDYVCINGDDCMSSDNLCVSNSMNDVKFRAKPKKKKSKKEIWKPTGKVFTKIGYIWRPTGRTFTIVGNACPLTRITTTNEVPSRKPIILESESPKPVVNLVYSRKPRKNKNTESVSKNKVIKPISANKQEPSKSWGSTKTNVPSTSLNECRLSKSSSGTVKFGNDQVAKIMGYGDYQIGNVTISRVYYVEGLGHNLFSVGQFCDSNLEVAFRQHTCFIRNLEGVDLLTGSRGDNLYTLSLGNMMASSPIYMDLSEVSLSSSLKRIGKSSKKPHKPKSEDTNQEKLYLLHMDLCGPMRVASVNGKKYILVIVDDYSRFTWVKCLRSKDEAPAFIINFLKMIQVRLKETVRRIRTDNGTEFVNQTLREYYEKVGISHETSVARSPQQNGVVENETPVARLHSKTVLLKDEIVR